MRRTGAVVAAAVVLAGCGVDGVDADRGTAARHPPAPVRVIRRFVRCGARTTDTGGFHRPRTTWPSSRTWWTPGPTRCWPGDEAAWLATVDPAAAAPRQQRVLFRNLVALGPASLDYQIDPATYLVPGAVPGRRPGSCTRRCWST